MIKTFKECYEHSCENFDPERAHGHFEYIVEKKDEGFLISECEITARDVRETAKLYDSRTAVWKSAVDCIEKLRGILGVEGSPSFDSVVFITAAKRLVKERDKAIDNLKLLQERTRYKDGLIGKTESDSV